MTYLSTRSNNAFAIINLRRCLVSVSKSLNIWPSKNVVRAGFGCLSIPLFDLRPLSFVDITDR